MKSETFASTLCERLTSRGDADAFVFLNTAGEEELRVASAKLHEDALAIAAFLAERYEPGTRVMIVQPPGFEFIRSLLGCMYAAMIAVPNYPPRRRESPERLERVLADSGSRCVLLHSSLQQSAPFMAAWPVDRICTDRTQFGDTGTQSPDLARIAPSTIAYLQYTSGSTGTPRGVMVTQANLLDQAAFLYDTLGADRIRVNVSWLPPYHDFGLVAAYLQSLYAGTLGVIMSPAAFAQKPVRWLQAITKYRGNTSGGPNFAYSLCARTITDEQLVGLDLESWLVAMIGSDQVEPSTMREFTNRFAPVGFRPETFSPAYGLAEATLAVALTQPHELPQQTTITHAGVHHGVDDRADKPWQVVESGAATAQVAIVNAERRSRVEPGRVGEIWVSGPSVSPGYWNQPEASHTAMGNLLAGTDSPKYLRTGDLGLVHEGRLYFVSRAKDLVILRGQNFYPADLEAVASRAHPRLRPDRAAAFSLASQHGEQLVLALELERDGWQSASSESISAAVEARIADEFGVLPDAVVLLRPHAIPQTLNGKVARHRAKELYAANALPGRIDARAPRAPTDKRAATADAVQLWLLAWLERTLDVNASELNAAHGFVALGVDSLTAVRCAAELGRAFSVEVPRYAALIHTSVSELARSVVALAQQSESRTTARSGADVNALACAATPMQQAYLVGRQRVPLGSVGCHVYFEFDVSAFDATRLQAAFCELALRSEALQTSFTLDGDVQVNEPAREPPFAIVDLTRAPTGEAEVQLRAQRERSAHQVFDPTHWPLFELAIIRLPEGRQTLSFSLDMLVTDAASTHALFAQWQSLYENSSAAPNLSNARLCNAYAKLRTQRASSDRSAARTYWLARLAHVAIGPSLPLRVPIESVMEPRFERVTARLPADAWQLFKGECKRLGVTPTAAVAALIAEALRTWSDSQAEFVLNFTTQERPLSEGAAPIGNFTSNMLVPVPERCASFADGCRALQRELVVGMQHAVLSGLEVARELRRHHAEHVSAFASAPVVLTSLLGSQAHDLALWPGEPRYAISQTPQVAMDFQLSEGDSGLCCNCDYVAALFPDDMPRQLLEAIEGAGAQLARDEAAWDRRRPVALPPAQRRTRDAANQTERALPVTRLEQAFVARARACPDAIALITPHLTLRYGQLLAAASELARRLIAAGVQPGECVAVSAPKGFEQVVAVIAVLLAGAAYVPVDPELPPARRAELLRKAACRHVLLPPSASWSGAQRVLTVSPQLFEARGEAKIALATDPEALAYVIFTSGSTGTPKGVMVSHAAAANTIADINARWQIAPSDRVLGLSALSFDLSVYDIFGTLAAGAALVLPSPDVERDPRAWLQLCDAQAITVWNSVPRLFEMFVESAAECAAPTALRLALLSGDFLPVSLARTVLERWPALQLVSLGGATEAAIWSIAHPITRVEPTWTSIPYGKPLANQTFAVVDPDFEDCPDGVSGELLIGGLGVARGYCGDDALHATAFITRPRTQERVYRTGDFGRYLPNGEIEILGRRDGQVKINGYRIELGDVEAALERHPSVRAAAALVMTRAVSETRTLRALVVAESGCEAALDLDELAAFARTQLPAYMLPHLIRQADALPLSRNGKRDRGRLAALVAELDQRAEVASRDRQPNDTALGQAGHTLERVILQVWSRVLGPCSLHSDANFFDLGGDSLLMLRAHRLLVAELGRHVPLLELYRHPKPRLLAELLRAEDAPANARDALAAADRATRRKRALQPRTR
jgi:amino acid adenylation domain-containing protein